MTVLKPGVYQMSELIEWFGIRSGTFYNNKNKYLLKLSYYCDFALKDDGKQIKIYRVYYNVYKQLNGYETKAVHYHSFLEEVWNDCRVDTIPNMVHKIKYEYQGFSKCSEEEISGIVKEWLTLFYGYTTNAAGFNGNAYNVLCTLDNDYNYQFLTVEQKKIFDFLFKKYFGNDIATSLCYCFNVKDIYEELDFEDTYSKMREEFKEVTGLELVSAISIVAFEDEEDEDDIEEDQYSREGAYLRL